MNIPKPTELRPAQECSDCKDWYSDKRNLRTIKSVHLCYECLVISYQAFVGQGTWTDEERKEVTDDVQTVLGNLFTNPLG